MAFRINRNLTKEEKHRIAEKFEKECYISDKEYDRLHQSLKNRDDVIEYDTIHGKSITGDD